MDVERLKEIEEIYHSALEIPANQRKSFVENRCAADLDLRREVESLLSFEDSADIFLDRTPAPLVAEMFAEENRPIDFSDREIRHYKVVKLLDRGGMGAVYLAEDTKLDRKVALKILPPEFSEDENRMNRFVCEAKSASALNHPNIITIYEIGDSNGTHYIATEFIDGETLPEYFKKRPLNLKSASGAEAAKVAKTSTIDPEAYQAYLKGRFYWNRRTTENIEKAVEQFKYAAEQDPNYALAYAGELEEKYAKVPSNAQFIAAVYAGLGGKDKVFEWLEKDFQNKEDPAGIRWSPQFESILSDAR